MGSATGCEASVPDAYAERLDMTAEPPGGFIQLHQADPLHSIIFQLQGK